MKSTFRLHNFSITQLFLKNLCWLRFRLPKMSILEMQLAIMVAGQKTQTQNTQAQNTQGQNTRSPRIPRIEIAKL